MVLKHRDQVKSGCAAFSGDNARCSLDISEQHIELFDIDDLDFEREDARQGVGEGSAVSL